MQNKICQQLISTAAEPSKQSEVLIDACEHPVDKGNADDDDHGHVAELSQMTSKMTSEKCNEPRSEELCGSGRKFQLSWKVKYNWIEYNMDKRCVFCSACTNTVKLQMPLTREGFICSICSKTQIMPALNNDPRTVKSHFAGLLAIQK